jgi:DNA topoisomerase VI subunit B
MKERHAAAAASNNRRPRLERVAFRTSRLAEFCGIKELTAQFGQEPSSWPEIIAKELVDNGIDGCEEFGVAPEISIDVSTVSGRISITDNGPGLPPETLTGVLDYTVRVSSREAYVSPTRGQQGNALKCIFAAAFALDGSRGTTLVETSGQAFRIVFEMDPVRREPRILPWEITPSDVQNGTRITVFWPSSAYGATPAEQRSSHDRL